MSTAIPRLLRRIAALLLLAVPVAAAAAVWTPYAGYIAGLKDDIAQQRTLKGRLGQIAAEEPDAVALERRSRVANEEGLFVGGDSEAIRNAKLQALLTELATQQGVQIRSLRNLTAEQRDGMKLIGAELQLFAPLEKLQKFLLSVEQARPVMMITSLYVTPIPAGIVGSAETKAGTLEARFNVAAAATQHKKEPQ